MATFAGVFLLLGLCIGVGAYALLAVAVVRRRGFRGAARGLARELAQELPLSQRLVAAAWTFVVGIPLVIAWTAVAGKLDTSGVIAMVLVWLVWFALLRWHWRSGSR